MVRYLNPWTVLLGLVLAQAAIGAAPNAENKKAPEPARTDALGDPLPADALLRLGTARLRHGTGATCQTFSPDGRLLATGGPDMTIRLWEAATGKLVRQLAGSQGGILELRFSPDGATLASTANDGQLRLWETASGREVRAIASSGRVDLAIAWSSDARRVFTAAPNAGINICDVAAGRVINQIAIPQGLTAVMAFTADGKRFACWSRDSSLRLWDVEGGREIVQIKGLTVTPYAYVRNQALAFAPDGKLLAIGGEQGHVQVFEVPGGKEVRRFTGQSFAGIRSVCFSPNGKFLAAVGADGSTRIWGLATGKELRRLEARQGLGSSLAFSPDGLYLSIAYQSYPIQLWHLGDSREMHTGIGHAGAVQALAFAADGRSLVSNGLDRSTRRWDVATGKEIGWGGTADRPGQPLLGALAQAIGKRVVIFNTDSTVDLWDVATGQRIRRLERLPRTGSWQALSPDARTYVTGNTGNVAGRGIELYDVDTGKLLHTLTAQQYVSSVGFTSDGKVLGTLGRDPNLTTSTLRLWQTATGKELGAPLPMERLLVPSFVFAPNGRLLASADSHVRLWEMATGKERFRIERPRSETAGTTTTGSGPVLFSPNGKLLAIGGADGTVIVCDAFTGKQLHLFAGHSGPVRSLAFSPDGRMLASGSHDTTVLVWDLTTIQPPARPPANRTAQEQEAFWLDLASDQAARAQEGMVGLKAGGDATVAFLKARVQTRPAPDPQRITRLVDDLDSNDFATREKATQELELLGEAAAAALRKALESQPPAEVRLRAERILSKLKQQTIAADQLRTLRAIEVLEQIATPAARQELERLARAPAGTPEADDARAALDRLSPPRP